MKKFAKLILAVMVLSLVTAPMAFSADKPAAKKAPAKKAKKAKKVKKEEAAAEGK